MTPSRTDLAIITLIIALAALPTAAQNPRADGEQLINLCEQYCDRFDLIHGNSMYYGGGAEQAREALATLLEVEREVLPEVQPLLAAFADSYGTNAMEVSNYFRSNGIELEQNVGNRFDELYRGVSNVDRSRRASAEAIAMRVTNDTAYLSRLTPDLRLTKIRQAKEMLVVGRQLDPANPDINTMLARIDADIQDTAAAADKAVDDAAWAGNTGSFAGPGSTSDLAHAALDFFRSHPNWTGRSEKKVEVLKVAVRGDWAIAETDIFGRPVSWRLPTHLAITDSELKPQGLARVYELSTVTRQGIPGATSKEPPFGSYWVGDSWLMRLKNLP